MSTSSTPVLWTPTQQAVESSRLHGFMQFLERGHEREFAAIGLDYHRLHRWSIEEPGTFWKRIWDFADVIGDRGQTDLMTDDCFYRWRFFPEAKLSFAENLLKPKRLRDPLFAESIALLAYDEQGYRGRLTRRELWDSVCRVASYFKARGIGPGTRVAAVLPNGMEAVVAMLATAAVGAIWSCCSPDFGDDALFDRFGQIEPAAIITSSSLQYNGKPIDLNPRLERLVSRLPSLQDWVYLGREPNLQSTSLRKIEWNAIERDGWVDEFERFPFHHPLAILYSSGTTGSPKCIVHGVGGTLLQHLKEHQLHSDIRPSDVVFYYTTTGWMMWNWLVSALASDATLVLFDGSPLKPTTGVLWQIAEETGVTHFGASARYYAALEQQSYLPRSHHSLGRLRAIFSTGSPLLPEQFEWLYSAIKPDLHLASISGGTDIVSCFVLGNPTQPVRAGEIQCKGLGMDVQVLDDRGQAVVGQQGELVCATPFPSMPLGFWNDPGDVKYQSTYFDQFPGIWAHGDWAMETESGGFVIFGRSDAVLNPGGVRIGTAEIYQQLKFFPEIVEGLATALRYDSDEQIVLFLKLTDETLWSEALSEAICKRLRHHCSPRHVPKYLVSAPDLPRTVSGKLSEIAARNAINGRAIGNAGALADPECFDFFRQWAQARHS